MKLTYIKPLEVIASSGWDHSRVLSAFMRIAACALCGPVLRPEQWFGALMNRVPAAFRMLAVPHREAQYLEEIKVWDADKHLPLFQEAFGLMLNDARRYEYDDVLGRVYQEWSGLRQKQGLGEFYTPLEVCYMMSKMTIDRSSFERDEPLHMNDATCGSGNMMLGAVRVAHELGYPSTQMLWVLQDISKIACDMAFINCCLYGVPALVSHRDTIRMTEWDANYTPWYPVAHGRLELPAVNVPASPDLERLVTVQQPLFALAME